MQQDAHRVSTPVEVDVSISWKSPLWCTISSAYETNIISLTPMMLQYTLTRKTSDLSWCVYPTDHGRLDNASYTTSVTSSVFDYQYVNMAGICVQWLLIIADMKCDTSLLDHELCWSDTERSQVSFISRRRIYSGTHDPANVESPSQTNVQIAKWWTGARSPWSGKCFLDSDKAKF